MSINQSTHQSNGIHVYPSSVRLYLSLLRQLLLEVFENSGSKILFVTYRERNIRVLIGWVIRVN